MRDRGVEVFHVEQLLTEALDQPGVRDWVSDHILNELEVGIAAAAAPGSGPERRTPNG